MITYSHYEIDSSSVKDFWLHDALQQMSMKQLDFFFKCASKMVFGKGKGRLGWKEVYIDVDEERVFDIEFCTNRIDRKFRFGFSSEYPRESILGTPAFWAMSNIFQHFLFLSVGFEKNEKERKKRFVSVYLSFYHDCVEATASYAYELNKEEKALLKMRKDLWQKQELS